MFLKPLNVEVMTVDKSQGLDNECILISCSKKAGKEHLMNVFSNFFCYIC